MASIPPLSAQYHSAHLPRFIDFPQPRYWGGWLILLFLRALRVLPRPVTWLLGAMLGETFALIHRGNTITTNIGLCFQQLSNAEQKKLVRRYYRRIGQTFFDLGLAWGGSPEQLKNNVSIQGKQYYEQAVANGKGVILLAPHFVGLEVGWARLSVEWPLAHMYRKPRNIMLHNALQYFRTRHGGEAFERYDNLKPLIKELRNGGGFYYLPDQDPDHDGKDYLFSPFFDIPTATFTALGRLATMGKAVVIPCITYQKPYGQGYEVVLKPPLEGFPTGNREDDTEQMNQEIEKLVREYPDQYFWSYRRFKTRPPGEKSVYEK